MQHLWKKIAAYSIVLALVAPVSLLAQKEEKEEKGDKEKKDVRQIIITSKREKNDKVLIEITGDKVLVNGKPLDEFKDKNGDLHVKLNKLKDIESLSLLRTPRAGGAWNFNEGGGDNFQFFNENSNRAMLGVTTEKVEEGAEVTDITKESAAEKMGLKGGDIIKKIDDKKIESPDDLSEAIKAHKPGDKVTVTYLRDKKEMKATAELTKWKGATFFRQNAPGGDFKIDMGDMDFKTIMPKLEEFRGMAPFGGGQNWSWSGGSPKLGLSVQDTDDGKGVKVVEVDEESTAAKAGVKEDDIITHLDDKEIKGVDEISKLLREKKDNPTVRFQLTRNGKSQNIEVKMPRKIKTADL
ncbi:MAG: PDZ domain-containing protein [Chitinophagaceae bacterium]|nr:PDZ domain-containing protein [Chitinophagaceae bacterium]